MEVPPRSLWAVALLCLLVASAIEIEEPEVTTEFFDYPSNTPTEHVTELSNDTAKISTNDLTEAEAKEEEEEAVDVEPQDVLIAFPENHKNFTGSQYLGSDEYLPYYTDYNSYYKQRYKHYYDQRETYNKKPIKFEENSTENYFLPHVSGSTESGKKYENIRVNRKPFPYVFESEREPENRYKNTGSGFIDVHEDRSPNSVQSQHENVPYYYYTHPDGYPHQYKDHRHEVLHHEHHDLAKHHDSKSPWKKVFHLLTALVPLGLFLATLTPNVISINSTTNGKTTRQRSVESTRRRFMEEDVLRLLKKYGIDSLSDSQCEDRVICELATRGDNSSANSLEKGFWYLANETPWDVAEKAGMNELFRAIRARNCESFKCKSEGKAERKLRLGKRQMKRRKASQETSHT